MLRIKALFPIFLGICASSFAQPIPCVPHFSGSGSFPAAGGSGSVVVGSDEGCSWEAHTFDNWITVLPSGSEYGSLNFTVAPNYFELSPSLFVPNPSPRMGLIVLSAIDSLLTPALFYVINQTGISCIYTPTPLAASIGPAGGSGSIAVITNSLLCPFQVPNPSPFIHISSTTWSNGSGTVDYTVALNTGPSRTGTLEIGGQSFILTQSAQPSPVSINSVSGSGAAHSFVFTFSHPDGWQNLGVVNVLINKALDGNSACYLAYDRPSNMLFLVSDTGPGGGLSGLFLNGSGSVSNSQCTVNGLGSTAIGSGNTLTLTLALTFNQTAFAGEKVTYVAARDTSANNSGWRTMGVWSVPLSQPVYPAIPGVTPSEGGGATHLFTITYRDASSSANLRTMQLLINSDLNGSLACYMGYDHASNMLYLVNDNNSSLLLPGIAPNSGTGVVENSQCAIDGVGTAKAESLTDLTLTVNLTFKPGFSGPKVVYTGVQTISNTNSDWHSLGFWSIPAN